MDEKQIIEEAKVFIDSLFSGDYSGHDSEHTLRVYNNALLIAETEQHCNRFVVSLAALLHDADDHKLFNTENNYNARTFLTQQNVDLEVVEQICEIINGVSFSKNRGVTPKTIEGKIVQDADRLDAMGAIGIARTFAYGGAHGRSIMDSIQHFEDKLLLLKNEMNTEEGKRIAQVRHDYLLTFVDEIMSEINAEK
ncbi:MAG: HD domain-containing protein [Clostridiales bacterium]|nr:HD domain-containing protein [Candidatus Blautia equi]